MNHSIRYFFAERKFRRLHISEPTQRAVFLNFSNRVAHLLILRLPSTIPHITLHFCCSFAHPASDFLHSITLFILFCRLLCVVPSVLAVVNTQTQVSVKKRWMHMRPVRPAREARESGSRVTQAFQSTAVRHIRTQGYKKEPQTY